MMTSSSNGVGYRTGANGINGSSTGFGNSTGISTGTGTGTGTIKKKKKNQPVFIGKLQPTQSRLPAIPDVNYAKGGSDFRCPTNTSSFGRQVLSFQHANTGPRVKFAASSRFLPSETIGPGPATVAPQSSLRRQILSSKPTTGGMSMGTSTRDSALKLYAIYTAKK